MRPIILCGDTEKVFLQNQKKSDKYLEVSLDKVRNPSIIEVNRLRRLVFGLNESPFILGGTLKQHFENYLNEHPKVIEKIQNSMYANEVQKLKRNQRSTFKGAFKFIQITFKYTVS